MVSIWKFPMTGRRCTLTMPKGAKILCVKVQYAISTIWAEVTLPDDDTPPVTESRDFIAVHTGDEVTDTFGNYLATILSPSGSYVEHIYEVTGRG